MCLVTYLPTSTGYILSSNRDEEPARAQTQLIQESINHADLVYPKDIKGGSWIFASKQRKNIVLLNGAFKLHKRQLPYRMSRGLMVKAYYEFDSTANFLQNYDFQGLEPFTLIIHEPKTFVELRWDGKHKHVKTLKKSEQLVWSSCTLYNEQLEKQRSDHYYQLIDSKKSDLSLASLIHNDTQLPSDYGFIMHRDNRVKTISTTHIIVNDSTTRLEYFNRETNEKSSVIL